MPSRLRTAVPPLLAQHGARQVAAGSRLVRSSTAPCPSVHQRARNVAALHSSGRIRAERGEDRRSAAICGLFGSIQSAEFQSVGQEQDRSRALPDGLKPSGFGARMQQGDAVAVRRATQLPTW